MHGFSQRLPVDRLQEHLAAEATHYLFPTLVQRLRHRPEVTLQWRCRCSGGAAAVEVPAVADSQDR
jgi:hypothetical protein